MELESIFDCLHAENYTVSATICQSGELTYSASMLIVNNRQESASTQYGRPNVTATTYMLPIANYAPCIGDCIEIPNNYEYSISTIRRHMKGNDLLMYEFGLVTS